MRNLVIFGSVVILLSLCNLSCVSRNAKNTEIKENTTETPKRTLEVPKEPSKESFENLRTQAAEHPKHADLEKLKDLELQIVKLESAKKDAEHAKHSDLKKLKDLESQIANLEDQKQTLKFFEINSDLWNSFKKKYSSKRILFKSSLAEVRKISKSQNLGLVVAYEAANHKLVGLPTDLIEQKGAEILTSKDHWHEIEWEGHKIRVEKIAIDAPSSTLSKESGEKLEKNLLAAFASASHHPIDGIVFPAIMTDEDNRNYKEWNDLVYKILVRSLIKSVASASSKPQFFLFRWVEIRPAVEQLIATIYHPYYVGAEEGLPNIECWLPGEAEQDLAFLHFEDEKWFSDNPVEFARYPLSLRSEEEARNFIIEAQNKHLVFRKDHRLANGYGKFVWKSNGCLYFRDMMESERTDGTDYTHASLNKGKKVLAGGWMLIKEGQIKCLNRVTGHYRSGLHHFEVLQEYLSKRLGALDPHAIKESIDFKSCCEEAKAEHIEIPGWVKYNCEKPDSVH